MSKPALSFEMPPRLKRDDGQVRRVGFELEFSGIDLDATAAALQSSLGAVPVMQTAAERVLKVEPMGEFRVELDWAYLKNKAAKKGLSASDDEWLEWLSQAAAAVVPVEVVCPPVALTQMADLDPMVAALRRAGAIGTEESLVAAYGVHVNPEIPVLDAPTLHDYIRAYALLQWWLVDRHAVDAARKLSPYIDLYPEAYVERVLGDSRPDMDEIFAAYLEHNASRNHALDLLPLLAEIDQARVQKAIDDARVKARPTFHYRLPDCDIERADWSLAEAWNAWCVVEKLAAQSEALDTLAAKYLGAKRFLLGVKRKAWVEQVDRWLKDYGLV